MPSTNETEKTGNKVALLAGGSGLVGGFLLTALLDSGYYTEVISIGRRTLPVSHPRLTQIAAGFNALPETLRADDYFCCLGTTISKAGSKAEFRKVDHDFPLALGKVAKANNGRFFVVTALGADAGSFIFYNRVKGELERDLRKLDLKALHVFRPSLLVGNRSEPRFGEKLALVIARAMPFIFSGPLLPYRPIPASLVAQAMLKAAYSDAEGFQLHESEQMLGVYG